MNIFYLDSDPKTAAQYHCDKHVVKMILESAQLLSTAHRVLDGVQGIRISAAGRKLKDWILSDFREELLYKATHVNHPSAIWTRQSLSHYAWLESLFVELCKEYTYRYDKVHLCETKLADVLSMPPDNLAELPFSEPPQAMPESCKMTGNAVLAYRQYYMLEKRDFAKWTRRSIPAWYV